MTLKQGQKFLLEKTIWSEKDFDKIETIAAGLCPPFIGELNLALVQRYVDEVVLVSDDELVEALWLILEHSKLLTEPSGAAG